MCLPHRRTVPISLRSLRPAPPYAARTVSSCSGAPSVSAAVDGATREGGRGCHPGPRVAHLAGSSLRRPLASGLLTTASLAALQHRDYHPCQRYEPRPLSGADGSRSCCSYCSARPSDGRRRRTLPGTRTRTNKGPTPEEGTSSLGQRPSLAAAPATQEHRVARPRENYEV